MYKVNVREAPCASSFATSGPSTEQRTLPVACSLLSGSHRLLAQVGGRVCVALDFGTSHSGFAYAHLDSGKSEGFYEWTDQLAPYAKTLSAISYKDDGGVDAWGHENTLRKAAATAGFVGADDVSSSRLSLILEPEAAALFCCEHGGGRRVEDKEVVMIVDAGGGTVDLTVHRVYRDKVTDGLVLKELSHGGGLCGSTFIDERFLTWLSNTIGKETIEKLKKDKPHGYWEGFKVPDALYKLIPQSKLDELETHQDGISEDILLTSEDMQALCDPVVQKAVDLVQEQIETGAAGSRIDTMFLVGGFASSKYLVETLKKKFAGSVGRIVRPSDTGAAVVQGAVLYGLNPSAISTRRARATYGLRVARPMSPFDAVNEADVFQHRELGNQWVWLYHPIVQKGQNVGVEEYYPDWMEPLYSSMDSLEVEVYAVDDVVCCDAMSGVGVSFSNVKDPRKLGAVVAKDLPKAGNRAVEARLYFGLTEVTIVARVDSTGQEGRMVLAVA
ncbi:hypothetical protein HDV00_009343 [Rhizophlyctis rosea]|nr:hypothetical protein HDV00_009343 [Rhizophlyctis rosea]